MTCSYTFAVKSNGLFLVAIGFLATLFAPAPSYGQQTVQQIAEQVGRAVGASYAGSIKREAQTPPKTLSEGQKVWLSHVPLIKKAEAARVEQYQDAVNNIDGGITKLYQNASYDIFAKNVLGGNAKIKMLNGQASFRNYVTTQFESHVLDADDLESFIKRQVTDFSKNVAAISDAVVIQLRADSSVNFQTIKVAPIEIPKLHSQLHSMVSAAETKAYQSVQASLVSFGAGMVAGEAAQKMFTPAPSPNQDAFTRALNKALGLAVDFAAGYAVGEIVNKTYDLEGKLCSTISDSLQTNLLTLKSNQSGCYVWLTPLKQHANAQREAFMSAVCTSLNVDRNWAEQSLSK